MKGLKIAIVMLVLIMSVGTVCAAENISDDVISDDGQEILGTGENNLYLVGDESFTNLSDEISNAGNVLDLNQDYKFNNETDWNNGISISRDNFVINGNGCTIDGNNQSRIFNITGNNITLNNLVLIRGNANEGGAIWTNGTLTLNNVTFIDNYASDYGGAVRLERNATLNCDNSRFIDNYAKMGSSIFVVLGKINLYNSQLSSKISNDYSQIFASHSVIYMENATFTNTTSSYASAFYIEFSNASIINSRFINLKANITAGAIGVKTYSSLFIRNCEFINITSSKNGGAIYADVAQDLFTPKGNVTIIDTVFKDTSSGFGGAIFQLGGALMVNNTEFINTHATYNGGSVFLSWMSPAEFYNCTFESGHVELIDDYPTYGGAIYANRGYVDVENSKFFNNQASAGSAIYAYALPYDIVNSVFENNTNPIYSVYDVASNIDKSNVFYNDDNVSTNNTFFETIMIGQGIQLSLLNNTINVTTIPSRFDLRDWGWVSPVRNQGRMGSCWTFGMTGSLESALLKAAGITTDFSENNMQNTMLRYSIYGDMVMDEGGLSTVAAGYLLSWLGAFPQDDDTYDALGKISPLIKTDRDIHIHDVMFIPNNEIPNGTQLKLAIMKYGSLDVSFCSDNGYYNAETYAHYVNEDDEMPDHAVSIIGWDDSFPKEKFLVAPPGDGAWIVKNSWGSEWGDNGYFYISYYDKTLLKYTQDDLDNYAAVLIIDNTEPYNKNYQYDMEWRGKFSPGQGNVSYYNVFEAVDNDLIAAIGTYFNKTGVEYAVEIFVNDELKLTQTGISPYLGYHTIKLDDYIPIKKGDIFKAKITSNAIPYIDTSISAVFYRENLSFISTDGVNWEDAYNSDMIACLKVYTVADDSKIISNENMTVDYGSESYFTVKVATAEGHNVCEGAVVDFTINGKTTSALTDSNGIAKILITEVPGNYVITTEYNGQAYYNDVNVRSISILAAENIETAYNSGDNLTVMLTDIDLEAIAGAEVIVKVDGVDTAYITDDNGQIFVPTDGLAPGNHIASVTFEGDNAYGGSSTFAKIAITSTDAIITADDVSTTRGVAKTLGAVLTDINGNPIADAKLKIVIPGVMTKYIRTDVDGQATLTLPCLDIGTYYATITFVASKLYNKASTTAKITVSDESTELTASDVAAVHGVAKYLVATLTDANGDPIGDAKLKFAISGGIVKYIRTDADGQAALNIGNLDVGTYRATITFLATELYNKSSTAAKITVKEKFNTTVTVDDVVAVQYIPEYLVASLTDENGDPIGDAKLKFAISGGVTKYLRTDANGLAALNIPNLDVGVFRATVTFLATEFYNKASTTAKITVLDKFPVCWNVTDITTEYGSCDSLVATLTDIDGYLIINEPVTVQFDGVNSTLETDENGQIFISTYDLNPGIYSADIVFGGNAFFAGANATANIIINKMSTVLTTSDINATYGGGSKLIAILSDENGNAIADAKLKIAISGGVTKYVRTDSNGQASLNLANMDVGSYRATVTFVETDLYNKSSAKSQIIINEA